MFEEHGWVGDLLYPGDNGGKDCSEREESRSSKAFENPGGETSLFCVLHKMLKMITNQISTSYSPNFYTLNIFLKYIYLKSTFESKLLFVPKSKIEKLRAIHTLYCFRECCNELTVNYLIESQQQ